MAVIDSHAKGCHMLYLFRRRLSRTWLLACVALSIAALSLIMVLVVAPPGLIPLGYGNVSHTGENADNPKHQPATQDKNTSVEARQPNVDSIPTQAVTSALPVLKQEEVIVAFDCARETLQLPPYQRDAQLDREAEALLQHFLTDGEAHLDPGYNGYTLTGQLLLDAAYGSELTNGCSVGGFDVTQVQDLHTSQTIGVALAPVTNAYRRPMYQTIIIGR